MCFCFPLLNKKRAIAGEIRLSVALAGTEEGGRTLLARDEHVFSYQLTQNSVFK